VEAGLFAKIFDTQDWRSVWWERRDRFQHGFSETSVVFSFALPGEASWTRSIVRKEINGVDGSFTSDGIEFRLCDVMMLVSLPELGFDMDFYTLSDCLVASLG
jgi:hypothetical protein